MQRTTANPPRAWRMCAGVAALLTLSITIATAAEPAGPVGVPEWRSFRGSIGAGVVPDSGVKLIDAAPDRKSFAPVWVSEFRNIPNGWLHPNGHGTYGVTGGYGGPVAVGDRVYIAWWEPDTDSPVDTVALEAAKDKNPDRWRVKADEVILCMDIATGKTVWTARFDGTGGNDQFSNHGKNYTPAIADGAVVLAGNGGWLYCVEPSDGVLRWKAKVGPYADHLAEWHAAGLDVGSSRVKDRNQVKKEKKLRELDYEWQNANPLIVAGVAVASDGSPAGYPGAMGLVAFDLASGEERWRVAECLDKNCSPVLWRHGDKTYVIGAGQERVVAIDPTDGAVVWTITIADIPPVELTEQEQKWPPGRPTSMPKHFMNNGTPALVDDLLVLKGNRPNPHPTRFRPAPHTTGPTCWDLSSGKPVLKWRLPRDHDMFCPMQNSWSIYRGYLYMAGRHGATMVEMASGKQVMVDKKDTDSFSAYLAGDGRFFQERVMYDVSDPAKPVRFRLPVPMEDMTMPFYANGYLFVRGPHGKKPDIKKDPEAARIPYGAVYCYDLRKK